MSPTPGIGGMNGTAPLAMTIFRAVMRRPSTSTVHGSTILALPVTQSTPSDVYRSTESLGAIVAIASRTRCITAPKSTLPLTSRRP